MKKPVILLAFANERQKDTEYLRNLPLEMNGLKEILEHAELQELCELEILPNASWDMIVRAFQRGKYRNRIAIFHYGGHAGSYELLLEQVDGSTQAANGRGVVPFLAAQKSLKLVFLNGCLTSSLAQDLTTQGIPAVIGTVSSVRDSIATELALSFYHGLANGAFLEQAWKEAVFKIQAKIASNDLTALYASTTYSRDLIGRQIHRSKFPWELVYREGAEEIKNWNLPNEVQNPLFGLPEISEKFDLPNDPYRFLKAYRQKDARIFFGRGHYIRDIYHRLISQQTSPVILLYGQSGVGKSSFLNAGLRPRLEDETEVIYIQRNSTHGLLWSLQYALGLVSPIDKQPATTDLLAAWKKLEDKNEKNLIIILDQVEEVFTRPSVEKDEWQTFIDHVKIIFDSRTKRPKGKLLLSYRKEFHPEIESDIKQLGIPKEDFLLKKLDKNGIEEIIRGLTSTIAHQHKYRLEIDEGLPSMIASDLLKDADPAISPILQIILTKLWSVGKNGDKHVFSTKNYLRLQKEGILLDDFFDQQMEIIREWGNEIQYKVEQSGLVLDILNYHTTSYATAESQELETIRKEYQHQSEILDRLIQKFKSLYLLSDVENDKTGLAHDTLAPIVQKRIKDSNKPGQRALRILETKMIDYERQPALTFIDEDDLTLVEEGVNGMRIWRKKERELIEKSQKRRAALEAERRRNRIFRWAAVISITIFSAIATFFWQKNQKEAIVNGLVSQALAMEKTDPTKALAITQQALALLPKQKITLQAQHDIYSNNEFYEKNIPHEHAVVAVAISRDDQLIATAAGDQVFLWNKEGVSQQEPLLHNGIVQTLEFSPDGQYLITGSRDSKAYLWNISGQRIRQFDHEDWVHSVAFSPDGQFILTGDRSNQATLWALDGTEITQLSGHANEVSSVAFSHSGDTLLTGSWDGTVNMWDRSGNILKIFSGHQDRVLSVNFSPNGKQILTSSRDYSAIVWDIETSSTTKFMKHEKRVNAALWINNGKYILTGSDDYTINLWNIDGKAIRAYIGHTDYVYDIAASYSDSGHWFASVSADSTLRIWGIESKVKQYFGTHENEVSALTFSSDGNLLMTASGSGIQKMANSINDLLVNFDLSQFTQSRPQNAYVWDRHGQLLTIFRGHKKAINAVAIAQNNQQFLTGGDDNQAILWNQNGGILRRFPHKDGVNAVVFSPSENKILTASQDSLARLCNRNGDTLITFQPHTDWVSDAIFSPDGQTILTACYDDTVRLFDLTGKLLHKFTGHESRVSCIDFSPNGKSFLSAGWDNKAILWTTSGEILRTFRINAKNKTGGQVVKSVAFSPDGNLIAMGAEGGLIKVFSVDGQEIQTMRLLDEIGVEVVEFSPDGKWIVGGCGDGEVRMWENVSL